MYPLKHLFSRIGAALFGAAFLLSPMSFYTLTAHASSPTDISTCAGLESVNDDLAASYELTGDLDCSEEGNAVVIGSSASPFTGTFDGQGYAITLDIATTSNNVGLFSKLDGASVQKLELDGSVSGAGNVGALAGTAADGATISEVSVMADVTGTGQMVGGIVGYLRDSTSIIEDSYSRGSVTGTRTGGIVGYMEASSQVMKTYATGHITSVGGIVGGIAGQTDDSGGEPVISDSFSTAIVDGQGDSRVGGIIGVTSSGAALDMDNDYFDIDQAGTTTCAVGDFGNTFYQGADGICEGVNDDGTDESHFKDNESVDPFSAWDFEGTWVTADDDYPKLGIIEDAHTPAPSPVVLTEVTPISSPTTADDARYTFSVSNPDDFDGEYEVTECGPGSCTVQIDPDAHIVTFTDLEPGDYDSVSFDFVYNDGSGTTTSNTLTVNSFTVIADAAHHRSAHSGQSAPIPSTTGDTQSQIDALLAQVKALQAHLGGEGSTSAAMPASVRDLTTGDQGADVTALQKLLIAEGYPIPAGATGFFANQTRDALAAYQSAHDIVPAVGYFGSITRAQMKAAGLAGLWW